jgi:hypothetical protein
MNINQQIKFIEDHGSNFIRWDKGQIIIETYFAKQFAAMGGDVELLATCYEDAGEISGAIEQYRNAICKREQARLHEPQGNNKTTTTGATHEQQSYRLQSL